jgi:hypothetical protein
MASSIESSASSIDAPVNGVSKISSRQSTQVAKVLTIEEAPDVSLFQRLSVQEQGTIEPELLSNPLHVVLGRVLPQHSHRGISRDETEQQKDGQGNTKDRWN